jgi:hypothetical protein
VVTGGVRAPLRIAASGAKPVDVPPALSDMERSQRLDAGQRVTVHAQDWARTAE